MKYDDVVYEFTGQMGRLQWTVFAGVCGLCLFCMESVNLVFVAGHMDHRCRRPLLDATTTAGHDPRESVTSPAVDGGNCQSRRTLLDNSTNI